MLIVDSELCIGCGVCEDNCAFAAIEVVDGCAVVGDACTLCGACVDSCEVEALKIEGGEKSVQVDLDSWKGVWVYCEFRAGEADVMSNSNALWLDHLGIGAPNVFCQGCVELIGYSSANVISLEAR